MTAMEATKQDWEDLRDRVEHKASMKMERAQGQQESWAGENDPELWVNIVGEKQRKKKLQQEIDQAIRAGNGRNAFAAVKAEEAVPEDESYFTAFGAFMFLAGMIVGAAVLFLTQYFL